MKILKLKLVNFIGIKLSMGLNEIEMDFSKSENKLVLLRGLNGSGKTTILSNAHLLINSNDERSKLILEGLDGHKQVIIKHNQDMYDANIYYLKSSNKAYIKKNGIELNVNGAITSYKEIVFNELGLKEDYFKIGRIGSNVNNFINMGKADRSKYIGLFLNDVDKYLKAHAIVNTKFNAANSIIQKYTKQLELIPDKNNLIKEIEAIKLNITDLENTINDNYVRLQKGYDKKKSLNDEFISININEDEHKRLKKANLKYIDFMSVNNELIKYRTVDEINVKLIELNDNYNNVTELVNNSKNNLNELNKDLINIEDKLSFLINKLNDVNNNFTIESLNERIEILEKVIANDKELFNYSIYNIIYNILIKYNINYNILNIDITSLYNNIYNNIYNIYINYNNIIYNNYNIYNNINIYNIEELENEIKLINSEINSLENKRNIISSNYSKYELLNKRPSDCKNDNCVFIKEILKYKNLNTEIQEIDNYLIVLNDKVKEKISELTIYHNANEFKKIIKNLFNNYISFKLDKYDELINLNVGNTFDSFYKFAISFNDSVNNKMADIFKELTLYITDLSEYENNVNNLSKLKSEFYEQSKNKKIYDETMIKISELNTQKQSTNDKLDKLKDEYTLDFHKLIEINKIKQKFNDLKELLPDAIKYLSIVNDLLRIDTLHEEISSIESGIIKLTNIIESNKLHKTESENKLNKLSNQLTLIDNINNQLNTIQLNYNTLKLIRDALDIKKGIPIYYTRNYLENIKHHANELLSVAYPDSNVEIDFNITEKEFDILLIMNGISKEVNELSQGETAIAKLCISLSMIKENLSKYKYNIIYLDELDSELDYVKKQYFIDIINKQIEILNLDQIFIISHSEVLTDINCDLILLSKELKSSSNNNIIFSRS